MYSQAIAGAEMDHTLFGNRSAAYLALGLYEESLQDAQKCVALCPTWAKGHYRCELNGLKFPNLKMSACGKLDYLVTERIHPFRAHLEHLAIGR